MKAIRVYEFGGPEVLQMAEVERPTPAEDEILIKVYATSVNPADYVIRQGGNEVLRSYLKLPLGLGLDAAGIVEETGRAVTDFNVGDKVYGVPNFPGDGSYAEYIAAKASQFSLMPDNITFNEAGALPSCALIAWNGINDLGKIKPGQRVLIHGAAGGVGTLAVQFAKALGGYVLGTASAYNINFLKELGADEVIDYNNQHFEELLSDIDLVFNASPVRDHNIRMKSVDVIKEGGMFVCTHLDVPLPEEFITALAKKHATATLVGGGNVITYTSSLQSATTLVNQGKVKAIVSKVYPLERVAEAHRESETKHVRGKIVLQVRKEE
jgi:NADPH:quinone reductase-like Zn-dependent oxidoreductase